MFNLRRWFGKKPNGYFKTLSELDEAKASLEKEIQKEKDRIANYEISFVENLLKDDPQLTLVRQDGSIKVIYRWPQKNFHVLEFKYIEGVGLCWKIYNFEFFVMPMPYYRIKMTKPAVRKVVSDFILLCKGT